MPIGRAVRQTTELDLETGGPASSLSVAADPAIALRPDAQFAAVRGGTAVPRAGEKCEIAQSSGEPSATFRQSATF
jgi:hypothetical protein